jgi:phosphoribosyl 1,2-cyclic phosphate phosphodiesterase
MKVTILGCGSSSGVPYIGCKCQVCASNNIKNNRTRASIHIQTDANSILVDASPDLRQQSLKNQITNIDSVLFTHEHADHTDGIADLRSFNYLKQGALDIYTDKITLNALQKRFAYAFGKNENNNWYLPSLTPHIIEPYIPFSINQTAIIPILQNHGKVDSLGFIINNFAYCTDVNNFPKQSLDLLKKHVKYIIIDCIGYKNYPTHLNFDYTMKIIDYLSPKQAILTHMGHEMEYDSLLKSLPQSVVPAYDGMIINLD